MRRALSRGSVGLARELEDVALKRDSGVELHDLREREPVVDAELMTDETKNWVVPVEEAVAVPQGGELLCPDRELKLAKLCVFDVRLGHHSNKCVEAIDGPVDRLETRSDRGAPYAEDHFLLSWIGDIRLGDLEEHAAKRVVDLLVVLVLPLGKA